MYLTTHFPSFLISHAGGYAQLSQAEVRERQHKQRARVCGADRVGVWTGQHLRVVSDFIVIKLLLLLMLLSLLDVKSYYLSLVIAQFEPHVFEGDNPASHLLPHQVLLQSTHHPTLS
jgi:hypothetical protein